ncbi:DUF1345 domain-containing protein [Acinetobacter soli]|uniref:DUF1345 domain-containing protein n=1 Tax=Acinetobacter soli TaxID=487316 RepID=UPI00125DA772|nr:DUF1345 domain-containing protein [Acinetobacter soli]
MNRFFFRLGHSISSRPHFFISLGIGVVIGTLLSWQTDSHWSTVVLISWNIAVTIYLAHVMGLIGQMDTKSMQQQAKRQDESKWVIMLLVLLALLMCMIAIVVQLSMMSKNSPYEIEHVILALFTIISAWLLMHTVFALHYAHDFYIARSKGSAGGLEFPQTPHPTYADFLYFSYIIGTSAQTADVSITSRNMRLLNIFHAFLAFIFNTSILAICINVAASFLSN